MMFRSFLLLKNVRKEAKARESRSLRLEALENRELLSVAPWNAAAESASEAAVYASVEASPAIDLSALGAESVAPTAESQTWTVTTNADVVDATDGVTSLREAIQSAAAGDAITFAPSLKGQTIALSGKELSISKGITIDASDLYDESTNAPGLTLDANQRSRVFHISGGTAETPVELVGLTITGGNAKGGGVIVSKSATTFTNCVVSGNSSSSIGGGVYVSYSTATFTNTTITGNSSSSDGGGVYVGYSAATFTNTTITGNSSSAEYAYGGGVYVSYSTATFTNTTITGNSASAEYAYGGGVYVRYSTATFTNTSIAGNSATASADWAARACGGGVYVSSNSAATFTNTSIAGNSATASGEWANSAYGGGVYVSSNSAATFMNTSITGNKATVSGEYAIDAYGGGVYANSSSATFTNATISGNSSTATGKSTAYAYGGGVYGGGSKSTLTFYNSIIILNTGKSGGNIYAEGTLKGYHSLTSSAAWPNASESGVVNYAYSSSKPLFTNAAKGDYTLAANSQALNKGNDAYAVYADGNPVPFDLLGKRRLDGKVDLGAYERSINAANPPIAASDLKATVGTDRVATLTWRDNATDETGYVVERLVDGVWSAVATLPADSTTWRSDEVLTSAAWREYRVAPTNANGRAPWTRVGSVVKSLVVTTNLDVVDDKDGLISLREAIAYSESDASLGGVVAFAPELKGTTITLSGAQLEIKQGIKIDASALWNEENDVPGITVDANELSRVFYVGDKIGTAENPVEFIGLTITGGKMTGSSSASDVDGGGVYVDRESTVKFTDVTIVDNVVAATKTDSAGGGVYVGYKSSATFINSTITGNGASSTVDDEDEGVWRLWCQGGGVYCDSSSSAIFDNTIISGNSVAAPKSESSAMGGGVHSLGNVAFTNSAIFGNSATSGSGFAWGGGFACNTSNVVVAKFTNTTIAGNSATSASTFAVGGVFTYATAEFYNSIVAQNVADAGADDVALALPGSTVGKANARNTLSSFTAWNNANENGVVNYVYDASLPLFTDAANGDYSLAEGSQAIDNGNDAHAVDAQGAPLTTDLAGNARIFGGAVDLGAYEYQQASTTLTSVSINGTARVGETLTANVSPGAATAAYQWYRVDANNVTTEISGATESTYVLTSADVGYYVQVVATGSGDYTGSVSATTADKVVKTLRLVVTTNADVVDAADGVTSLREAIQAAKAGDAIAFDASLKGATITLSGKQLEISKGITVDASDLYDETTQTPGITIDANQTSRVFYLNGGTADVPLELIGLTITGGGAQNEGGGVYVYRSATATLTNCVVRGNKSKYEGGGVYADGTTTLTNCEISGNAALEYGDSSGVGSGGGVYAIGDTTLTNCRVSGNKAKYGGGVYANGTTTLVNCEISDNTALYNDDGYYDEWYKESYGGGVYAGYGTTTLTNCVVNGNAADNGGGVYAADGTTTLTNCAIRDNAALFLGGGVYLDRGSNYSTNATLTGCDISGNTAENGAGVWIYSNYTTLANCVVSGNAAAYNGGGLFIDDGITTLTNCAVIDNASEYGDGVGVYADGYRTTLTNCVVSGNASEYGDVGGVYARYGTTTLYNSIVALNTASASGSDVYDYGTDAIVNACNTLSSYSVWDNASADGVANYVYDESLPLFNDEANGDYALAANSQAINKGNDAYAVDAQGNALTTDLAGNARLFGTSVDLGPYEYQQATPLTSVTIDGTLAVGQTLTATVAPSGVTATYQWRRGTSASDMTEISGANDSTYVLTSADLGYYIEVVATGFGYYAGSVSATTSTAIVNPETPSLVVTTDSDVVDLADGQISLREAIAYAEADATLGDKITFAAALKGKTITLSGTELAISKGLTVDASDLYDESTQTPGVTIDAGRKSRVFYLTGGTESQPITLKGLTITGGYKREGGGVYVDQSAATLTNCVVSGNEATYEGGGIHTYISALTLTNCVISGNKTTGGLSGWGGGVCVYYTSAATFTNCVISDNTARIGGGVYSGYSNSDYTTALTDCVISGNTALVNGGGVYAGSGNLELTNCSVSGNTAEDNGGGVYASYNTTLTNCAVSDNTASSGSGGGVYSKAYGATLANCAVSGNTAEASHGGGVYVAGRNTTFTNCVISGNATACNGGGVYFDYDSDTTLYNTIVALNTASVSGSDVYDYGAEATVDAYNALSSYAAWDAGSNNYVYDASLPLFNDAKNGDYSLAENSQAIDKGNNAYAVDAAGNALTTDMVGKARVIGDNVDLGPYEYPAPLTSVSLKGTAQVGKTITATLSPSGAEATYQWFRVDANNVMTEINGATAASYQPTLADLGYYIRVIATGSDSYEGVVSAKTSATVKAPLTSVSLSGTAQVDKTLTASVSPSGAEATYQWYRVDANNVATAISGATASTYQPTSADVGYNIRVIATGAELYVGSVSAKTAAKVKAPLTSVSLSGSTQVGETLTASVSPNGATATYRWLRVDANGVTTEISGATEAAYVLTSADLGYNIQVVATGSGFYLGSVSEVASSAVTASLASVSLSGAAQVGETLTASVSPNGATATYQWYRVDANDETTEISGATEASYQPTIADLGYYIRVIATGSDFYTGFVSAKTSAIVKAPLTSVSLKGSAQVGKTLTASVSPSGATATYQWYRVNANNVATAISGATASTYQPTIEDLGCNIRVIATGSGSYMNVVSAKTSAKVKASLTSVEISGVARVGQTLTASVSPNGATATWQWYRVDANDVATAISGATESTYDLTSADLGYSVQAVATGSGNYVGSVSTTVGPIDEAGPVPAVPTNVTFTQMKLTKADGTYVNVKWTDVATDETGYRVEVREVGATAWTLAGTTKADKQVFAYQDFTPGVAYECRVRAENEFGASDWATGAFTTMTAPEATVASYDASAKTATLTLAAPTLAAQMRVEVSTEPFASEATISSSKLFYCVTLKSTATEATVKNLEAGTTYYVRVRAINGADVSDWCDTVELKLGSAPAAPTNVTFTQTKLTNEGGTAVNVKWTDVATDETGYRVEVREVGATAWTLAGATNEDEQVFAYKNVTPGVAYEYRVRAENAFGASDWATGAFTALAAPSATVANYDVSAKTATLNLAASELATQMRVEVSTEPFASEATISSSKLFYCVTLKSSTATPTIKNLESGTTYYVRVRAINDAGVSDWCDTLTLQLPTSNAQADAVSEAFADFFAEDGGEDDFWFEFEKAAGKRR